jgi:hypothetical protein
MNSIKRLCLLAVFLSLGGASYALTTPAGSLTPSDSAEINRMVQALVSRVKNQIRVNQNNAELGLSEQNKYFLSQEVGDEGTFKMIVKNQEAGKSLWDESHPGIQQVKHTLQAFNRSNNGVKYYVLVASIYNYYKLEETLSNPRDWRSMPTYSKVKDENLKKPGGSDAETNAKIRAFFFNTLLNELGTLPDKNIIHIVTSFYIPYTESGTGKKKYALYHHQGLAWKGLPDNKYRAVSRAIHSAEKKVNEIKQKESWLSAAVDYATYAYTNAKEDENLPDKKISQIACVSDSINKRVQAFADVLDDRPDPEQKVLVREFQAHTNGTLTARTSWAMDILTDKNYFVLVPDSLMLDDADKLRALDNRIAYMYSKLSSNNEHTYFYVVIQNIGCKLDNEGLFDGFAQKVYDKSTLKGKKCILLTIPIWISGKSGNRYMYQVGKADIYDNTGLLEDRDVIFTEVQDVPYIIQSTYRQIKKPYTRYDAYLNVSGGIDFQEFKLSSVSGYNSINESYLWVKDEYAAFKKIKQPQPVEFLEDDSSRRVRDDYGGYVYVKEINQTKYALALFNYILQANDVLERARQNPNGWKVYQVDEKLNEWCIPDNYKAFAHYVFKEDGFIKWLDEVAILVDIHEVDRSCITDFDVMGTVDPIVYAVLDGASLIPGVDNFADGAGLLYATGRGDMESAGMYAVGLAVPGAGTLVLKGLKASGRLLLRGAVYLVDGGVVAWRVALTKAEELKIVTRQILKFKNPATAIADHQLEKLTRMFQNSDGEIVKKIIKVADENIEDTEKLQKLIKLMDGIDFNLLQVKQGVESILGNKVVVTASGNTVEIVVKETQEKILVVCTAKAQQQGLEYTVKNAQGADIFVDAAKEGGWSRVGDKIAENVDIKTGNNTLHDALAVVEKTDGQGKKIIRIGNCFPAGTMIQYGRGKTKPIEQVQAGDTVLSMNTTTALVERHVVTRTYKRTTNKLAWVYGGDKLVCQSTPEHPFWLEAKQRYVKAEQLIKGDRLTVFPQQFLASIKPYFARSSIEVDGIVVRDTTLTVYNFEVEGQHNYFVGEAGVLVHNADYDIIWGNSAIKKRFEDAGLENSSLTHKFRQLLARSDLSSEAADGLIHAIRSLSPANAEKAAAKINSLAEKGVKFLEDVNAGLGTKIDWARWDDRLVDAWARVSDHGVRMNADFLKKVAGLGTTEQGQVTSLYAKIKAPKGLNKSVDFSSTKTIDGKAVTVRYDNEGFPIFTSHSPGKDYVYQRPKALTGEYDDMKDANEWAKQRFGDNVETFSNGQIKINGEIHTWHHHQDGITMFPVPSKIHNSTQGGFNHSGGAAIIDRGLVGLFSSPIF